jgi:hypothetical protein
VAIIYLNHKESDAHSPSKLLASVWRQLVFRKPISADVRRLYEEYHEPRTRPSLDEDHVLLCSIIKDYSKVSIIVDALDEYPEEPRHILLGHLLALGPAVNLMVTSRPHITIDPVNSFDTLEIRATEADLRNYLDGQIRRSHRLSKHIANSDLREAIEARIIQRCDGMYVLSRLETFLKVALGFSSQNCISIPSQQSSLSRASETV